MEVVKLQSNPCYEEVQKADRASNLTTEIKYEEISGRSKKKWTGVLLVGILLQALLLIAVVVAAGFFSKEIIALHGQIEQLQLGQIQGQLLQANDTKIWLLLSNLKSFAKALNTTTMHQLSDLQSSVNTLNTTTMGQLSDLQSSVNILTSSSVDLYQGCTKETRRCTVSTNKTNGITWSWCTTSPSLYISPTVSKLLVI